MRLSQNVSISLTVQERAFPLRYIEGGVRAKLRDCHVCLIISDDKKIGIMITIIKFAKDPIFLLKIIQLFRKIIN